MKEKLSRLVPESAVSRIPRAADGCRMPICEERPAELTATTDYRQVGSVRTKKIDVASRRRRRPLRIRISEARRFRESNRVVDVVVVVAATAAACSRRRAAAGRGVDDVGARNLNRKFATYLVLTKLPEPNTVGRNEDLLEKNGLVN